MRGFQHQLRSVLITSGCPYQLPQAQRLRRHQQHQLFKETAIHLKQAIFWSEEWGAPHTICCGKLPVVASTFAASYTTRCLEIRDMGRDYLTMCSSAQKKRPNGPGSTTIRSRFLNPCRAHHWCTDCFGFAMARSAPNHVATTPATFLRSPHQTGCADPS
jgi:hypothetical protein